MTGPTLGVEVELAFFAPGRGIGERSPLPGVLLKAAHEQVNCVQALHRFGYFTSSGLLYCEMDRFLEASSWPAGGLEAALCAEEAILELVRRVAGFAKLDPDRFAAACYPDHMAGVPLPRLKKTATPDARPALPFILGHQTTRVRACAV